jgi:hypothetical protein
MQAIVRSARGKPRGSFAQAQFLYGLPMVSIHTGLLCGHSWFDGRGSYGGRVRPVPCNSERGK